MTRKPSKPVAGRRFAVAAGIASTAALALGLGAATPAAAQSTPNVIVDLSVLNAPGGYAPYPPVGAAPQPYGQGALPYGGQQPYGQPRQLIPPPYGGPQAGPSASPLYGGYLIMPNTGYGPPQPTLLAPPPPTLAARPPARSKPIPIAPDPRPALAPAPVIAIAEAPDGGIEPAAAGSSAPPEPKPVMAPTVAVAAAAIVPSSPKPAPVSVRVTAASPSEPKAAPIVDASSTAAEPTVNSPAIVAEAPVEQIDAPAPPPAEAATVAALPPASEPSGSDDLAIEFDSDSAELDESVYADLDAIAARLTDDEDLRVRLVAYAEGDDDEASKARRLSLSRALVVRGYLIKQGIRSTRMDVRALGNKIESGPGDRVDVLVVTR